MTTATVFSRLSLAFAVLTLAFSLGKNHQPGGAVLLSTNISTNESIAGTGEAPKFTVSSNDPGVGIVAMAAIQYPAPLIEIYGNYPGEPMAIIYPDGHVELNNLYDPNESAYVFWEAIAEAAPCR